MANKNVILILGAGGYLGETTIREAVAAGKRVIGLVRSEKGAERLRSFGAEACVGDATRPHQWQAALADATVIIDLVQPPLSKKITLRAMKEAADERVTITSAVCKMIAALPRDARPTYLSVGGTDELASMEGVVTDASPLRSSPFGGGRIGAAAHQILADSGLPVAWAYLGMVYGNGKLFGSYILPSVSAGKFALIGSGENRLPLVHVEDAARALLHIASLGSSAIGRSFVVAQPGGASANTFFNAIASEMGVRTPGHRPPWLVKWFAGQGAVEFMTANATIEPQALLGSGFSFRYRTLDLGVKAMVNAFRAQHESARSLDPARG